MKTKLLISTLLIGSLTFSVQAQKASNYKIVNKIHLEGDGKWDYLFSDDAASRLYVSHQTMVQVVDETTGQVIGKITGMNGVHGIAIVSDLNKGYISSGKDTMVTVFDTKTFNVITKITASGVGPDAIFYDPYSKKIFTCNGKGHSSSVIDPETDKIIATIELTGKPESGVSDGNGKVYVNFEKESQLCEINSATFKVENVWPLAPGEGPTGLSLDNENHRLFSACDNKMMMILDAETGKIVTSVPIGENVDGDAFDPGLKVAYTSNGEGNMTVIEEDNKDAFEVAETFPTQRGAKTITVNRKTHHIYMSTADLKGADDDDDNPHAKPKIVPGTFVVLDIAPIK